MGRIGLEKLLASLRDKYGFKTTDFVITGEAALVIHDVVKEVPKPVIGVTAAMINKISETSGITINRISNLKKEELNLGIALLTMTNRKPDYYTTEVIGPFTVETLNTATMVLLTQDKVKHESLINRCFANGAHLLLEAWPSDVESIEAHYGKYPEYYKLIEDGEEPEVEWKTLEGIEVAKHDHIFLEYIGMMYVNPS